jgi:hypothetical protein
MTKKTEAKNDKPEGRPVLVTTEHRGVFFGYAVDTMGSTVILEQARMCIYWSPDVRGFMGLATTGPSKSCRVGPAVPRFTLHKVTSVSDCTPEAIEAWEKSPWSL